MEAVVESLEMTIAELLKKQEIVKIPATVEEYFDLIQEGSEYDIEYYDHEIIAQMSIASDIHELLVATIIRLFGNQFLETDCRVYGSNRPVYVPECQVGFNADVLVVKGPTELFPRKRTIAATLNPRILVEVISPSNDSEEFYEKLTCYRKIASLQQVILVSQNKPSVSTYTRTNDPHEWLYHDYDNLEMLVKVEDFEISMKEIYRNVF